MVVLLPLELFSPNLLCSYLDSVQNGPRHPVHGDLAWVSLVIDSRFLAVDPYSSRVRSAGPEGYVPFFEEKPWITTG